MLNQPGLAEPLYVLVVESVRSGTAPGERRAPPARYNIKNRETTIGRSPACTIRLDDMFVSRRHARLLLRDQELYLEDLQSTNESRLNGVPVPARVRVHPGDLLLFGGARCRIESFGVASEAGTAEPAGRDAGGESSGPSAEAAAEAQAKEVPAPGEPFTEETDPWRDFKPPRTFVAGPLPGEPGRTRLRVFLLLLGAAAVLAAAVLLLR